jgi:Type VI secretion system/phage-baseplate injector OB domain
VVPTETVYEWLTQANVSAWVFIQQLAALENCVAYADAEGVFHFGPIANPADGLPPAMSFEQPPTGTQLVKGLNLIRLRATVSGAEQVPDVTVTGYDPVAAIPIVGIAPGLPSSALSLDPGTLPATVAGELGSSTFMDASRPFTAEGAASTRARAIAGDLAGALSEMEGECIGNPSLQSGASMSIGMAGLPFDGQYIVSSARHVFEPGGSGYTTWFTVGGFRDRSLFALSSGTGPVDSTRPHIGGVVVGKVTDNDDVQSQGRVKVRFPWLSDTYVSAWARTVQIGASAGGSGFLWVPEVGDEVLVGFDRGDIDHPYIIGNLYNGVASPEPSPSIQGAVANRRITSRMRHTIQFDDGPDDTGVTIRTGDNECSLKFDAEEQSVTITSLGKIAIQAGAEGLTLDSEGDVSITATGTLSMSAASVSVDGDSSVSLSGADLSLSGEGSVSVSGPSISLGA